MIGEDAVYFYLVNHNFWILLTISHVVRAEDLVLTWFVLSDVSPGPGKDHQAVVKAV